MDSKNKRKFRVWDSKLLFDLYGKCAQVAEKIESKCDENTTPLDLPVSLIPTDFLYEMVCSYNAMYNKLLDENLLVAGYPKSTKTNH